MERSLSGSPPPTEQWTPGNQTWLKILVYVLSACLVQRVGANCGRTSLSAKLFNKPHLTRVNTLGRHTLFWGEVQYCQTVELASDVPTTNLKASSSTL